MEVVPVVAYFDRGQGAFGSKLGDILYQNNLQAKSRSLIESVHVKLLKRNWSSNFAASPAGVCPLSQRQRSAVLREAPVLSRQSRLCLPVAAEVMANILFDTDLGVQVQGLRSAARVAPISLRAASRSRLFAPCSLSNQPLLLHPEQPLACDALRRKTERSAPTSPSQSATGPSRVLGSCMCSGAKLTTPAPLQNFGMLFSL